MATVIDLCDDDEDVVGAGAADAPDVSSCNLTPSFYFVPAEKVASALSTRPLAQMQELRDGGWLKKRQICLQDAFRGIGDDVASTLFVSHRWETPGEPDGGGVQMQEIRDFLNRPENRGVQYVFYDYSCMAQGACGPAFACACLPPPPSHFGAGTACAGERTDAEKREFKAMLPNINILYMGALVLVLMDLSYMSRFWTQARDHQPRAFNSTPSHSLCGRRLTDPSLMSRVWRSLRPG